MHDEQFRAMSRAKRREPLEAKPHQTILMRDDESPDLPELDLLQEASELLALIIQPATNLLNPLIRLLTTPLAVVAQRRDLMRQVTLLPNARYPRIDDSLAPASAVSPR